MAISHTENTLLQPQNVGTNKIMQLANEYFTAATTDASKHFVPETKFIFCGTIFTKRFCWCTKTFFAVQESHGSVYCLSGHFPRAKVKQAIIWKAYNAQRYANAHAIGTRLA